MEQNQFENYDEIDLFEYFDLFWKQKWAIILIVNFSIIASLVYTLFIAKTVYESQTSVMTVKSSGGGSFSALRALVPTGFGGLPLSQEEEDLNRFINILTSRVIVEEVARSLDLHDRLYVDNKTEDHPEFQEMITEIQKDLITATDNKKGLLIFAARANTPQLAADIANAFVQHLQRYLRKNTITESRRNRIFIEEQYNKSEKYLSQIDQELQNFKEKHKIFSITAQAEQMIKSRGTLEGELIATEIELEVIQKSNISPNNPKYKALVFQINALKKKIREIEIGTIDLSAIAIEALPRIERELAQLMREQIKYETLFGLLAQEFEQAKISEASDEISIVVLDPAIPPIKRSKPKRSMNLMLGGVIGVMFAFGFVIFQNLAVKYRE